MIFFSILLICCFFLSCSKETNISLPPVLQKLTEQTECICNPFIDEYSLNGNTIYLYSCGGPACDCVAIYYNAQGEEFQPQSGAQTAFARHVWSCKK